MPPSFEATAEPAHKLVVIVGVLSNGGVSTEDASQGPAAIGSEDFAFMLEKRPGCYLFIGNGAGAHIRAKSP